MQRAQNFVQRAEHTLGNATTRIESGLDELFTREADRIWDRFKPRVDDAVDDLVQKQVKKYQGWILLLYVMVGIAVLFSVLGFIKVAHIKRV